MYIKYLIFFIFFGSTISCCCKKDNFCESFSVFIEIEGPFLLRSVYDADIVNHNMVHAFSLGEKEVFVVAVNNMSEDSLFVKTDLISGYILTNERNCEFIDNNKIKLVNDYSIIDNGPVLIDRIAPNKIKKYYADITCGYIGVLEFLPNIRSSKIDSFNNYCSTLQSNAYIKHRYPFASYEINNCVIKKIKYDKFISMIQPIQ